MDRHNSLSNRHSSQQAERLDAALAFLQRAHAFQMGGRLEDAIICYKKSLELCPTAEAYTLLGWAYSFQRRYQDAIRECERAIQLDPHFGNPYNDIGAYLIELGQAEEAIPWLEMAIVAKRYETRAYPHLNLGRVYEQLGKWREAELAYQRAIQVDTAYLLAHRALNRLRAFRN